MVYRIRLHNYIYCLDRIVSNNVCKTTIISLGVFFEQNMRPWSWLITGIFLATCSCQINIWFCSFEHWSEKKTTIRLRIPFRDCVRVFGSCLSVCILFPYMRLRRQRDNLTRLAQCLESNITKEEHPYNVSLYLQRSSIPTELIGLLQNTDIIILVQCTYKWRHTCTGWK